jgi:hypothetical protein
LYSPIRPQNHDSSTLIASIIVSAVPSRPIVKFIAANRFIASHREHSHVYSRALPVQKFPFLILLIPRNNSQRFVTGDRRISSHGLIVYPHSSVDSAAPNQISHQIGNICLAIPPTILRAHDPPDARPFILRGNLDAQQTGTHHDHRHYCGTLN